MSLKKTVLHHLRAFANEIYKSQYYGYFYSSGNGCLQSYFFSSATKPINNELNTRSEIADMFGLADYENMLLHIL